MSGGESERGVTWIELPELVVDAGIVVQQATYWAARGLVVAIVGPRSEGLVDLYDLEGHRVARITAPSGWTPYYIGRNGDDVSVVCVTDGPGDWQDWRFEISIDPPRLVRRSPSK